MSTPATTSDPATKAFYYRNYRFFWLSALSTSFAVQIMSVAVGWQVYDLTGNTLYLGLIGLLQFLPALLLVLVTGLVADKFNRRMIMAICLGLELICAFSLFLFANAEAHEIWPIFIILVGLGLARAFLNPAVDSLAPNLVPPQALANAIAINSTAWQLASILGPVAGGLLYGLGNAVPYGVSAVLLVASITCVLLIGRPPQRESHQATSMQTMLAGFRYIWGEKIVLGAISLDLFAVLLGGAVALMPVFARDILEVGPWGLGLLRSAPGIGAIAMALALAAFPIRDHAGKILFIFVFLFGLFTLVFGLSKVVWLSIPMLVLMGATDMVSVVLRETLMQLWTPDEVRGRVSAVNRVFIGASNELGEFRAGIVAFWIGASAAVAIGGAGTMLVAVTWPLMFPGLAKARKIDRRMV